MKTRTIVVSVLILAAAVAAVMAWRYRKAQKATA